MTCAPFMHNTTPYLFRGFCFFQRFSSHIWLTSDCWCDGGVSFVWDTFSTRTVTVGTATPSNLNTPMPYVGSIGSIIILNLRLIHFRGSLGIKNCFLYLILEYLEVRADEHVTIWSKKSHALWSWASCSKDFHATRLACPFWL